MLVVADGARLSVHGAHRDHPGRDRRELVLPEGRRMRPQRHLGPRSDARSGRTMAGGTTVRRIEAFSGSPGERIPLVRSRDGPGRKDPPTPSASEPDEQARDGHSDDRKGGPAAEIPDRPSGRADRGRASARAIGPGPVGARPAVFLGPGASPCALLFARKFVQDRTAIGGRPTGTPRGRTGTARFPVASMTADPRIGRPFVARRVGSRRWQVVGHQLASAPPENAKTITTCRTVKMSRL